MIIKYTNFSDGIHEIEFNEPVSKYGLDDQFQGAVDLVCKMDKAVHQIVVDCHLKLKSNFVCDRCTQDYSEDIVSVFTLSFIFSKDKTESEDSNVKFITPDQEKIDLSEDVIEYARISVPMKKLCKEDCKGLCLICGSNLNEKECGCVPTVTNDVWEPLKKLKGKFNN